ncbi:PD-(D/E)XK nuclease family protein [uncultured Brachyspira sp.]|uniref:PDDEXK-like family protein n=1 Tax=uncultured Brachyspira sp. TaxID=221953 RepID=UPI002597F8CF|nr:PD-(D/E)XK nuclease family protein [uncultured Brachyspira sp.]
MAKSLTKEENILLTLINAFQNDEKEKLNHLGNISKSLIEVRKKVKDEMEKLPPQFNVFNSINLLNHENYNSNLFANFLDIKFKHNGNEISFAKLFLKYLNEEFGWEFDLENIKIEDIEIKRELSTEERKRIDIFIGYKEKFAVIIENKIWADDGYKQLENYYNHIKSQEYDKIYMIYLTPYEREPSENSLNKELYQKEGSELYGKFKNIKHEEIGKWINKKILKNEEFSFLNIESEDNKNDYKLLKSALIQIINNELSISQGDKMTEGKIKKILEENIFKDIKTVEDVDEYINMFKKDVIELLEGKKAEIERENRKAIIEKDIQPYLKFTKEVDKYLESKGYKEGKDYNLLKDEDIINMMTDYDYPQHIGFNNINNIFVWLESYYENDCISYYFGICTEDENIINQINKKQLKTSIENIFSDFNYTEEDWWIFRSYIDIEKDKPQEIAEVMIKLYELLKKEIK